MKELSIEEKAKRYDEALKVAKEWHTDTQIGIGFKANLEKLFPELKESEDERIRKALLELVHDTTGDELWVDYNVHKEDALAWLEKQGEITKEWSEMKINNIQTELQEMVDLKQKTEQGEQNPYGQRKESEDERTWIINYLSNRELNSSIIAEKENLKKAIAWLEKQGDKKEDMIQNACEAFCQVRCKGNPPRSTCTSLGTCMEHDDFCKAIKKQGEQKPAEWSKEDEEMLNSIKFHLDCDRANINCYSWLDELKDRVLLQPKQEWSDEDVNRINRLIAYFEDKESFTAEDDVVYANWLRTLRPQSQWKPSEELLDVFIKNAIDFFESNFNPLTDGGVIGAFDDKEKMIEEFKEYMKEEGLNEEWI